MQKFVKILLKFDKIGEVPLERSWIGRSVEALLCCVPLQSRCVSVLFKVFSRALFRGRSVKIEFARPKKRQLIIALFLGGENESTERLSWKIRFSRIRSCVAKMIKL